MLGIRGFGRIGPRASAIGWIFYGVRSWIVRCICEKGVVKISELRKIYQSTVVKDRSVQFRPLPGVLKAVNENLLHWQGWNAVIQDDRLTYVNVNGDAPNEVRASETERTLGLLKNVLMYVFVATKPQSKHPGVAQEDLMSYMEASMSTHSDRKLSLDHMEFLKKLIAPNARSEFIKKGYLAFTKSVNENDEEVFRYEWGPAARQTVDPLALVQTFQQLTGMKPEMLKEQTERANELKAEQVAAVTRGGVLRTRGQ